MPLQFDPIIPSRSDNDIIKASNTINSIAFSVSIHEDRIADLFGRVSASQQRIGSNESDILSIQNIIQSLTSRISSIESKYQSIDIELTNHDTRITSLENKNQGNNVFKWIGYWSTNMPPVGNYSNTDIWVEASGSLPTNPSDINSTNYNVYSWTGSAFVKLSNYQYSENPYDTWGNLNDNTTYYRLNQQWNTFGGTVDLSPYRTALQQDSIDNSKASIQSVNDVNTRVTQLPLWLLSNTAPFASDIDDGTGQFDFMQHQPFHKSLYPGNPNAFNNFILTLDKDVPQINMVISDVNQTIWDNEKRLFFVIKNNNPSNDTVIDVQDFFNYPEIIFMDSSTSSIHLRLGFSLIMEFLCVHNPNTGLNEIRFLYTLQN